MRSNVFTILLGAVLVFGCGPSKDQAFHASALRGYYKIADAESGGSGDHFMDLVREGRASMFSDCGVRVIEPGPNWTKIEVMNGSEKGAEAWVATGDLK